MVIGAIALVIYREIIVHIAIRGMAVPVPLQLTIICTSPTGNLL